MHSYYIGKSGKVIVRENTIDVEEINIENVMDIDGKKDNYKEAIFFDLEHYVYKKPICIGVFGSCYYDEVTSTLNVVQYMIENKREAVDVLYMAKEYFNEMYQNKKKRYIVTFSGNNDFSVINYLFNKYNIDFDFKDYFINIDIQKEYEKRLKESIGLKNLEKRIGIEREGEVISGANLAKTFGKVIKDSNYIKRMPEEKIEKILLYNEQDVVNLFHIYVNWLTLENKKEEDSSISENIEANPE